MRKKRFFVFSAILSVAAMYGCEDETGVSGGGGSTGPKTCQPSLCPSGKCLPSGECDPGDVRTCDPSLCPSGKCLPSGECDPNVDPVVEPCEDEDCEQTVTYLNENDSCDAGDDSAVCRAPLICYNNRCTSPNDNRLGKSCASDDDCADQDPFTKCMSNDHCGYVANVGEACEGIDGGTVFCEDGAICSGACIQYLHEGDPCDRTNAWRKCDISNGEFCIEGACHQTVANLGLGEECNENYRFCDNALECFNHVCTQIVREEESCNPDNHIICPPGSTIKCLSGTCKRTAGSCASSADCTTSDTYCCSDEDNCGAAFGQCIPYEGEVVKDETCRFQTKPGIFEAQVQCRWQPPSNKYPDSKKVEMPPLVGNFGNKNNEENKTVIAVYSFKKRGREVQDGNNAPITDEDAETVIRFIDPVNCNTLESIRVNLSHWWNNYPAAADLDGDGILEFIVPNRDHFATAYKWDESKKKHVVKWTAEAPSNGAIMVYDVNGDGKPEVIGGTSVINGETGKTIFRGSNGGSTTYAIGNFDNDPNGYASQLRKTGIYKWNNELKKWEQRLAMEGGGSHTAYADFGTPKDDPNKFDFLHLDGKPEYVISGGSKLVVYAEHTKKDGSLEAQLIMNVTGYATGGPVTIGDFDNDGLPEIGIASKGLFGVYDPRCKAVDVDGCADKYVLWERWSQDKSSGATGSSLFDFDGDGQTEAVYADECFTRVYDGKTGEVLFSTRRSSSTSIEAPVIADIDNDGSAEILMGSDENQTCYNDDNAKLAYNDESNNAVDPIHEGIKCEDNEDCPNNKCNQDIGLCVCDSNDECNTQYLENADGSKTRIQQYICTAPIHPQVGFMKYSSKDAKRVMVKNIGTRPSGWSESKGYKVCRATRKHKDIGDADLMILKDRLDRWVSSRPLWNQHAYNIINIEDNGRVPTNATWLSNWADKLLNKKIDGTDQPRPKYNNYRLNSQGEYGAGMAPDITGKFKPGSICGQTADGKYVISAKLCNRGTKPAGKDLPASFFYYDETAPDHRGKRICTSYTNKVFVDGECADVGCEITEEQLHALEGQKVLMVTNLDEHGQPSTVECNGKNNTDVIEIDTCQAEIVIVN